MSAKAGGCWLDAAAPELLPGVCSRRRSPPQSVVFSRGVPSPEGQPQRTPEDKQVLLFPVLSENNNNASLCTFLTDG